MHPFHRFRPTPSFTLSMVALMVALGGTAYAATQIHGKNIKNGTITGKKVKRGTLTTTKLSKSTVAALRGQTGAPGAVGPRGAPGAVGPAGAPGEPATRLFASVDGGNPGDVTAPVLQTGSGVTNVVRLGGTSQGRYVVTFNRDVSRCVPVVSVTTVGAAATANRGVPGFGLAAPDATDPRNMFVRTSDTTSPDINKPFALAVFC